MDDKKEIETAKNRRILSHCPFAVGESINYIFAKRDFHNKKPTLFNFYTADEEFLVLSGSYNSHHKKFVVTTNSRTSDENSPFFIGNVMKLKNDTLFLGKASYNTDSNTIVNINVVKVSYENSEWPRFSIAKPYCVAYNDEGVTQPKDEIVFVLKNYNPNPNSYSLVLEHEGVEALSMNYKDIDEFSVQITHPLSLFQGYAFCISFLSKMGLA